jgi:SepF-like predicted cell division protein (DUF552 family)
MAKKRQFEVQFWGIIGVEAKTKEEAEALLEAALKDHIVVLDIEGIVDVTDPPTK